MKYQFTQSELERIQAEIWLTDRQQKVFNYFYRRGWFIEDIACELDVSRRTVTNDLQKIRKKAIEVF